MKRGTERLFAWSPLSWAVRRSSDGLWQWDKNGPVLPWFAYKKDKPNKCALKFGEYMFFLWWNGRIPFSIRYSALWIVCKLSLGYYRLVDNGKEVK